MHVQQRCPRQFKAELKTAVADAVDAKVAADGGVNQAIMKAQLDTLLVELRTEIRAGSLIKCLENKEYIAAPALTSGPALQH